MSFLGLDPTQESNQLDQAIRNPGNSDYLHPSFWDGSLTAPVSGLVSGFIAKPALVLGDAATPVIKPYAEQADAFLGTHIARWMDQEQQKNVDLVKSLIPTPQTVGTAGQVLFGLGDILPEAIAGNLAGGPAGAAALVGTMQGYASTRLGMADGLDTLTALGKGVIEGGAAAAGVTMPMSIGLKLLPNLAFGAGSNLAFGIGSRGATSALLEANGYHDMAQQYQVLDQQAMKIDAVMGLAFGALGTAFHPHDQVKVKPSDVDAALAANNAQHLEVGTLPGLPTDLATRDAHVDAMVKATEALISGEPVDVSEQVGKMIFAEDPHADAVREKMAEEITAANQDVIHNTEWRMFPENTGTLGIDRADMPQVANRDRPELYQYLADNGIEHTRVQVPAESLQPTQKEYSLVKAERASHIPESDTSDLSAVLISSDGYILDGHHRWIANLEAGQPVNAIRFNAPIHDLIAAVKDFPKATTSPTSETISTRIHGENYDYEKHNFDYKPHLEFLTPEDLTRADTLVEKYYTDKPAAKIPAEDQARAEKILEPMMANAEKAKNSFDQGVVDIAEHHGALGQMLTRIKGMERAAYKLATDYKFDPTELRDVLRATIVVRKYSDVQQILNAIDKRFEITRIKNRTDLPLLENDLRTTAKVKNEDRASLVGYGDALVNVRLPNGTIAEIQINIPEMIAFKLGQGHKLYEAYRDQPKGSALESEIRGAMEDFYNAAHHYGMSDHPDRLANSLAARRSVNARQVAADWKNADSDIGPAPPDGMPPRGLSISPESASENTLPSGNSTRSSPSNVAQNLEPAGNLSGNGIGLESVINGSPLVDERISQNITNAKSGSSTEINISGKQEPAHWALVDADTVAPSIEKADNQYRDRTRAASQVQVQDIANKLDFKMLAESPVMDFGAPTLSRDGHIIGGNGRVAAVAQAYDIGTGAKYRAELMQAAERFGLKEADAAGMKKPMLVRILDNQVDVKKAAIASNEGGGLRMSALEQSKVDAERLGNTTGMQITDNGELNIPGNREFIKRWVGEFPPNQQAALIDADGYLSAEGVTRLRNAVLHQAYGDSPALARLVESADPGARNVVNAMVRAAPNVAEARSRISEGSLHPVDIVSDLIAAVEKFSQLKIEGKTVADHFAQTDFFGDTLTPEAKSILSYLEINARSAKAIGEMISGFYDRLRAAGNPGQGDLLGSGPPGKAALLEASAKSAGKDVAQAVAQQALFDRPNMTIKTETGETVLASKAMQEADAGVQQAQRESSVFDAAIQCALRG